MKWFSLSIVETMIGVVDIELHLSCKGILAAPFDREIYIQNASRTKTLNIKGITTNQYIVQAHELVKKHKTE